MVGFRDVHFIIEYDRFRGFRERDSGVQFALRVFGILDGFQHFSEVNGTRDEHGDIHESQHFAVFHECFEAHALSVTSFLREHGDTAFRDTADFCHHVGCTPRGYGGTVVRNGTPNGIYGGNLVKDFRVSADNE